VTIAAVSLFWRVYLAAAGVLVLGALALVLLPVTVSERTLPAEIAVLAGGVALLLAVTVLLLRRSLAPLDRLVALARGVDLLRPGQRLETGPGGDVREVTAVVEAFNGMLGRLEGERAESARRTLTAQEEERMRIARELHDEVGGTLTAVLLHLSRAAETAPPDIGERLHAAQEAARAGLDDVGRVVRSLRPEALADLGLESALSALGATVAREAGLAVRRDIGRDLPALSPEAELIVYRVAQEALTNAVRHSGAAALRIALARGGDGGVVLEVEDDGRGIRDAEGGSGGIRGMRERALLVQGRLDVGAGPDGGTLVRLVVPPGAGEAG
jgi:two-component system sensor histidine kinase UhpB